MLNLIVEGGIAICTYWFLDKKVKDRTGKHIHQHVFDWWCGLRDYINEWLLANTHLGIRKIGLVVLDAFDEFAVRTKQTADRITLGVLAVDKAENEYEVTASEVSVEEALAQFPELRQSPVLVHELEA